MVYLNNFTFPNEDMEFILEFDVSNLENLFAA